MYKEKMIKRNIELKKMIKGTRIEIQKKKKISNFQLFYQNNPSLFYQ